MKQVLMQRGQPLVVEVPPPQAEPGTVLVQVQFSCISTGTELSGLSHSGQSLWQRAWQQPHKLKQVLDLAARQGLRSTYQHIQGKLAAGQPCGYSAAGSVLAVGPGISNLEAGDRVACAGSQWAYHAQIIRVPRNLAVRVPAGLDLAAASTVALGAIALQGVRRAQPTLGETFVVLGLGALGQLTVQLLKANGCTVLGADLDEQRIRLAQNVGLDVGLFTEDGDPVAQVARRTDGYGADGVIITAAARSSAVISTAFRMCRRKGRVVLVGDVGLDLHRADLYEKELDFFISTSYGPGRYDYQYEEQGLDYPIGYVRWTENRNMEQYLRLLAQGQITVEPLIGSIRPVEEAPAAYAQLQQDSPARPLLVLLSYPPPSVPLASSIPLAPRPRPAAPGPLRLAVIGAGHFAQLMHLPNVQRLPKHFQLRAIVGRSGHSATTTARRFSADYATTRPEEVLADPRVDAVLIATRHHLHAALTLAALEAGKHVLVEKPLALQPQELEKIKAFFLSRPGDAPAPLLLTGFNRRFSPHAVRLKELLARRSNPMILHYCMNAGYLPPDHWVHGNQGGGRNRGEACHVYDLFTFLTDSAVLSCTAQAITPQTGYYQPGDNFAATFHFADGSVGNLVYTALGSTDYPKERLEVFVDGKVLVLDDYKDLTVTGARARGCRTRLAEKGHREELLAFAQAIQQGAAWPIPLWQQVQATEMAFTVEQAIQPSQTLATAGISQSAYTPSGQA